jgi:hypothetical protein
MVYNAPKGKVFATNTGLTSGNVAGKYAFLYIYLNSVLI